VAALTAVLQNPSVRPQPVPRQFAVSGVLQEEAA
jgi:hypothetical protein